MAQRLVMATLGALAAATSPAHAQTAPAPTAPEPTIAELQRQIDELKAVVEQLKAAQQANATATPAAPATPPALATTPTPRAEAALAPTVAAAPAKPSKHWFDRISVRGYTQLRVNEIVSGDRTAPAGISRLRSVQDGGIADQGNFTFRRLRLILQGDLNQDLSLYFQTDFANGISNQTANERREGFAQLRDAYVDWFLDDEHEWRLRFGQSKVPFGWENLQSSSNRVPLDRTDALNSAVPSERDLGVVAYYTPTHVLRIWDRLTKDGQKLFGNYGAFGVAAYNGQGVNRAEQNNGLMLAGMATWPFELDGLGGWFDGQVLEVGGSVLRNSVQPELRTGGVSATAFDDNRVGVHAILYPQPFGIQAEWNWGEGPEYDTAAARIETKKLTGGYVQSMFRIKESPVGPLMPYARWQYYRGGWKAGINAPRLETEDLEFGIEFQPVPPIEVTVAYAHMKRREADERRFGQAEGDVLRTQLQWSY